MKVSFRFPAQGYVLAILAVGVVFVLRWYLLAPMLGSEGRLMLFLAAVAVTAWLAGFRPALLALLLSAGLGWFFLLHPYNSSWIDNAADQLHLFVFVLMGLLLGWLIESMRQARIQAEISIWEILSQQHKLQEVNTALQVSEERLLLATRATNDAIWDLDFKTGVVWWNEAYNVLFGERPFTTDTSWDWWIEHLHPDDRERVVASVRTALDGSDAFWSAEYRYRRMNGSYAYVLDRCYIVRSAQGRPLRAVGAMQDLTERKQAEQALRESEERYRISFDMSVVGKAQTDSATGRFLRVNRKLCAITGYSEAELLQRTFSDITHPDDRQSDWDRFRQMHQLNHPEVVVRKRYIRKDQSIRWVEVSAALLRDAQGQPIYSVAIIQDITERLQAEQALQQALERIDFVLSSITEAHFVLDSDFGFIEVNPAAQRMVFRDMPAAELLGRPVWDIFPEGKNSEFYNQYQRAMREQIPVHFEGKSRIVDRWFEVHAYPREGQLEVYLRDVSDRKQAEQALRESEERLSLALDIARLGAWDWNVRSGTLIWSEGTFRILGYEVPAGGGEVPYHWWSDCIHAEDRDRIAQQIEAAKSQRSLYSIGHRIIRFDSNEVRWVNVSGRFLYDEQDQPIRMIGVTSDVTDRLHAEEALRKSEERLRRALMAAPLPVTVLAEDGQFLLVNQIFQEITGYSEAELPDVSAWTILAYGDESPRMQQRVQRLFDIGERIDEGEIPVRTHSGELRYWHFHSAPLGTTPDGRRLLISMAIDTTERRQAELALRASEARFRQLADAMPQMVWTTDAAGQVDYFNQRWYQFTGRTPGAATEHDCHSLLHPDERERMRQDWQQAVRSGQPYETEQRLYDYQTQEYRWHLLRAVPIRDEAGRIIKWYGTTTDIHAQKLAAESLREADRRKDEFLATLAHELRNPLAPISNAVELMGRLLPDAGQLEGLREMMSRQVHQMIRLIDDLLDVSRITRGKLQLRKETLPLATVLTAALEAARPFIESAGHALSVEQSDESLFVTADPARLAQIVTNLLNNAAKYTPAGGHIWLCTERQGGEAVLRIRDNGQGMPPDQLTQVFEMFVQLDRTLNSNQSGLGVGLTLVKRLVEMHGGSIRAASAGRGQGSEFTVRLPLAAAPPISLPAPLAETPSAAPASFRILVVEDVKTVADIFARILKELGHTPQVVPDGLTALAQIDTFRPDIVFSDISMPGIDGYELARRLRAHTEWRRLILVALTGYGQAEDRERSLAAGFDHHLVKPVEIAELLTLFETLAVLPLDGACPPCPTEIAAPDGQMS